MDIYGEALWSCLRAALICLIGLTPIPALYLIMAFVQLFLPDHAHSILTTTITILAAMALPLEIAIGVGAGLCLVAFAVCAVALPIWFVISKAIGWDD